MSSVVWERRRSAGGSGNGRGEERPVDFVAMIIKSGYAIW